MGMQKTAALAVSSVFAIFTLNAAGAVAHDVEELPDGVVQVSPEVPAMGAHWGAPDDLPLGPIYGSHDGEVVFLEFMIAQADFEAGKSYIQLASKLDFELPAVDHVDIEFIANGHEGFEVPHYDVHLYFVSHDEHMSY